MNTTKRLIASTIAILLVAGTLAASDETSASVAALKASLGDPAGLVVDEVRMTDAGFACIKYRVGSDQGARTRGHAVVHGDEVLKSSSADERFEKTWNDNCLGPRGGMTVDE